MFSASTVNIALSLLSCIYAQNISALLSKSITCGPEICQPLVQQAITFEHDSHATPLVGSFYTIPASFKPSMKPGTLLSVEAHTDLINYTVPAGLTMSRIVYTSLSLNGTVVPVSAFVLWPYAPYSYKKGCEDKFPLVAWAHGTAGLFAQCAPSNYRSLQYNFMTSYSLALEGFAVVATDYAGLGVTTLPNGEQSHTWLAAPAAANDVAYAIEAARKAFPQQLEPEGPFVTMGHSQGGNAAWAFAERQAQSPVPGYRGTVAISPPNRVIPLVNRALQVAASTPATSLPPWVPIVLGLQHMIVATITAVYPAYNLSGLTPLSYDAWINVVKPLQGCLPTDSLAFAFVPPDQIVKPQWTNNKFVKEWDAQVSVSGKKFKGPLLVIAGDRDVIPVDEIQQNVKASCQVSGDQGLEFLTYSDMEHFPIIQASRMKWMGWIKEKISGDADSPLNRHEPCGKSSIIQGFNQNNTIVSVAPNWLVGWIPAQEGWKHAL